MNILETIKSSEDIKLLENDKLTQLCTEIREFLIENVSKTGGHLASNLGIVELTVAMHRVFDFPEDKIIFDVGHQSYVHKIITDRKDKFNTLRTFNGISGFPKRCESDYDSFNTGHSSTSISAALGMARAREINNEKYNIIALFGDGALTGGMMFEAMNDAGQKKLPLILILNDNAMSISKNVGAISMHLRNIRISSTYFKSKVAVDEFLKFIPFLGAPLAAAIRKIKRGLRSVVLPTTLFDDMGFEYLGPVDGHNLDALIECLEHAKKAKKPIVLHVHTKKGKGYLPAEKNPAKFHGIGKFDKTTGETATEKETYSDCFGAKMCSVAKYNDKVVAITAAMPYGTGLNDFSKLYPDRFFDVGIAEEHAMTLAAGMATNGVIPVIPIYSSFLQRAYDQILHDVCLQNLHVVIPIDRAGIVGADGETHQGLYDIAFLSHIPNMSILSPSSFDMLEKMLEYAISEHNGPIAIRYPRGNTQHIANIDFEYGKAIKHSDGTDLTIITTGRMTPRALQVAQELGYDCDVLEIPTIKPIDKDTIFASARKTSKVVTIEDGAKIGGMGQYISSLLHEEGISTVFYSFAFGDCPITHGTVDELDKMHGLDTQSIVKYIKENIEK